LIRTRWKLKENWRRLLAELVIVAVGVGVALAVDNWNETRKELVAERDYLQGITADLNASAQSLERTQKSAIENRAALEQLIAIANGATPPSDRELAVTLVRATYLDLPRLTTITFEELVSTGSLRILRNTQFKRALAESLQTFRHQSQWYDNYRRIEYNTENALRGLAPIEVRTEGFDALEKPEVMARFNSESVVRALRNVKDIVPILEDSVWTQARAFRAADILLQSIDAQQAMLDEKGVY
jgi:hypothetical protein